MNSVKIDEEGVHVTVGDIAIDVDVEDKGIKNQEDDNKPESEESNNDEANSSSDNDTSQIKPEESQETKNQDQKKSEKKEAKKKPTVKKKKVVITGEESEDENGIRKRLATERHPTIEAILNDLFRFETEKQAQDRIDTIRDHFIISKKLPKDKDNPNTLKLWIRGYGINKDEEKKGYLGNYAAFRTVKLKDDKFTIRAEKQPIALKYHPQRKRPKRKHPDWGHPALRLVKKQVSFDTIEEANNILKQIHTEYPDISIPSVNKLFVIIYSKAENPEKPVQKYILEVKPAKGGGFYVDYKINDYKKKQGPEVKKQINGESDSDDSAAPKEQSGYFTSMVALKRNRKSQIDELRKKKQEEESN